jgi:hypothetical protein
VTARQVFTPQVLVQLGGVAFAAVAAWFGIRADVRSVAEEQARQRVSIEQLSARIPDGAVLELRLQSLEKRTDAWDPSKMISIQADIQQLQRESREFGTKLELLTDYTEGRISGFRYRPPSQRH